MLRPLAVAALAALCGACSSAPLIVPAGYDGGAMAVPVRATGGCPLQLATVKDLRADPGSLGAVGNRQIQAQDFAAWFRGGMDRGLAGQTLGVQPGLTLDAEIVKAYLSALAMSKTATIVVRVRYSREGRALGEKVYRGANVALNWAATDSELHGALVQALESLVSQVQADASGYCAVPSNQTVMALPQA